MTFTITCIVAPFVAGLHRFMGNMGYRNEPWRRALRDAVGVTLICCAACWVLWFVGRSG